MTDGAALATAYVHKDTRNEFGKCDTYNFHYYMSMPVSISTGDPVFIAWNGTTGTVTGRHGSNKIPGEVYALGRYPDFCDSKWCCAVSGTGKCKTDDNCGYTIATSEENTLSIVVVALGRNLHHFLRHQVPHPGWQRTDLGCELSAPWPVRQ